MQCPNCQEILVMAERRGVEIDYCPKCRGVWLDRGELDRLIQVAEEEAAARPAVVAAAPAAAPAAPAPETGYRDDAGSPDGRGYDDRGRPRKKRSWLSDMMEFD